MSGAEGDPPRSMSERSGHPEIAWTILLEALVASELRAAEVGERLRAAWPGGAVGPPPEVTETADAEVGALAAVPFDRARTRCRVVVTPGSPSRVVVVGDHGALDGLGLVGVLGAAIGRPLGTTARGVDPSGTPSRSGIGYPVRRLAEALVRPPARIASTAHPGGSVPGDHLVRVTVDGQVGTAALVAAAARAVRSWNAEAGRRRGRVVVAVGASTRPGTDPGIAGSATWFRLPVPVGADAEAVSAVLRRASPQPEPPAAVMRAATRSGVSRAIAGRTGSTLLVSHLGGMRGGGDEVVDAAFYPSAHGRSGVAVGAVGVGGRTILTLRARRRDFPMERAAELLERLARQVS